MKIDKRAAEKLQKQLEKDLKKSLDKETKKHPISSNDSTKDIEGKLKKIAKGVGATPDAAQIKKDAKDIHKDLHRK